jgi:hypothetical protein
MMNKYVFLSLFIPLCSSAVVADSLNCKGVSDSGNLMISVSSNAGCTDSSACNYNSEAIEDDGSCLFQNMACDDGNPETSGDVLNENCDCAGTLVIPGCMNEEACNYNQEANEDDDSCAFPGMACDDGDSNTIEDVLDENCECAGILVIPGCMNEEACNYNPEANQADDSCTFPGMACDDGDSNTIEDVLDENCECAGILVIPGCTNEEACNYHPEANQDDGLCQFPGDYCSDDDPFTFDDIWTEDCECIGIVLVFGCMNPNACNYNPEATQKDGSCVYPGQPCDDGNPETFNDIYTEECDCQGSVSVAELVAIDFLLYPNPASGYINIRWEFPDAFSFGLFDISGRLLRSETELRGSQTLDLSSVSQGVYLIVIESTGSRLAKTFIKQ